MLLGRSAQHSSLAHPRGKLIRHGFTRDVDSTQRRDQAVRRFRSQTDRPPSRAFVWIVVAVVAVCALVMPLFTDSLLNDVERNLIVAGSVNGGVWGVIQQAAGYLIFPVLWLLAAVNGALNFAFEFVIFIVVAVVVIFAYTWIRNALARARNRRS